MSGTDWLALEYEALKREQTTRTGTRDNLIYATIAAIGLTVAAASRIGPMMLLLLPPITTVLGWTHIANDIKVSHIGAYLRRVITPQVMARTSDVVLEWEHRSDDQRGLRGLCQLAVNQLLFAAAPLSGMIVFWWLHPDPIPVILLIASWVEAGLTGAMTAAILLFTGPSDDD